MYMYIYIIIIHVLQLVFARGKNKLLSNFTPPLLMYTSHILSVRLIHMHTIYT